MAGECIFQAVELHRDDALIYARLIRLHRVPSDESTVVDKPRLGQNAGHSAQ
jgi:hypothetical protein